MVSECTINMIGLLTTSQYHHITSQDVLPAGG